MENLKDLVGSIINSFLGPFKSNKLVFQDKDICITRCPLHIFQSSHIQGTLSSLIEETLLAHHELYGCSTLSLLTMWYLWNEEFNLLLEEGCKMQDIIVHSQDILELVISSLSDITVNLDSLLVFKKHGYEKVTQEAPFNMLNAFGQTPISVLYSSRHFSPSQSILPSEDEGGKYRHGNSILDENSLKTLIQRLDHDADNEMSDLVLECWKRQISVSDCLEFHTDGILICPIILPCFNSTIIDGLVIKSNSNYAYPEDRKKFSLNRSLVIKNITFEHVHLGFSPKVYISVHKTFESSLSSEREKWRKKCCEFIMQINVDALLIKDDIDPEVANFCSSHSILVLPHIPLELFKVLCCTFQYSPCTYIWDCNEDSVLKNLTVEEWKPHDSFSCSNQYFLIRISSRSMVPPQTIVLCHPSQAVLLRMKHQLWHLLSRVKMCFQSKKMLPGGEVEEWCSNSLRKCLESHEILDARYRIRIALANGYLNYSKIVSSKKVISTEPLTKTLDEMSSKVNAWRSALSLVLLTLQCDTVLINGVKDVSEHAVNLNVNTL